MATVWRTTWDHETKVLTGAWASCRVETMAEQIERLTRERGAEKARADAAEKRLAGLRSWAMRSPTGMEPWELLAEVVARIDRKEDT
jgi:hypothetical protein